MIGGDAVNDVLAPPRNWSTSEKVEELTGGADIIDAFSDSPHQAECRQGQRDVSLYFPITAKATPPISATMAKRAGAKPLILTHLIPPIGTDQQYPFKVMGSHDRADYREAAQEGGFTGDCCRQDRPCASLRLPAK